MSTEGITNRSVETALNERRPLYVARTRELESLAKSALAGALDAHQILYTSEQIRVIADPDSGANDKYVTLSSPEGQDLWVDGIGKNSGGIRGINLGYAGDGNRTTVMHVPATEELPEFLRRTQVSEQLKALQTLGRYAFENYTRPYLMAIAEVYGVDQEGYLSNFGLEGRIMRAILYHTITEFNVDNMPTSTDGSELPLAIKEHNDKGAFTDDIYTTGGGLQYLSQGIWRSPPDSSVAIFPGAGDTMLSSELRIEPVTHRVVHDPSWQSLNRDRGGPTPSVVRAAFPMFTNSTNEVAKIVIAGSADTHPTYYQT
jgi:hypothetical protein